MTPDQLDRVLLAQRDPAAARLLVESYLPLVQRISGRVAARYRLEPRELVGAGTCALYEALRGWREDGGAGFFTYAWQWVWKRVIEEAKAITCQVQRGVQADDDSDREAREAARIDVDRLLARIPADEAHLVIAVYLRGQTTEEAAESFGVHRNTARAILRRGIVRMRTRRLVRG